MRPETVSQTAFGTAIGRALENSLPREDRLFDDPYAIRFLPLKHRAIVHLLQLPVIGPALLSFRERQVPGVMGNLLCRTRFIDDTLREALSKKFQQCVILGAGLDSRPYRILGKEQVSVFEVDHPATQAWKRSRIESFHDEVPTQVTFVPVDFEREELGRALDTCGFEEEVKTLFIWEGVTQYITAQAVDSTFRYISNVVSPGSRIVFTYIHRGLIEGSVEMEGAEKLLSELQRQGEPWRFGIDPAELSEYLDVHGFRLIEDVGAADYRERYLEPMGREMNLFEGERVAVAEVASR